MIIETSVWDVLCNICILVMEHLSHLTGLSYGFINIIIFVVLEPLAILSFMGSTLALLRIEDRKKRETTTRIFFTCGVIAILMIIIPIMYAFITCPGIV
jgi:hypothetical protein